MWVLSVSPALVSDKIKSLKALPLDILNQRWDSTRVAKKGVYDLSIASPVNGCQLSGILETAIEQQLRTFNGAVSYRFLVIRPTWPGD
jgi:hypothetical protein